MTSPAKQLYFDAVKVGDEMPPLVKPPVDRIQITRYAGASLDFNPLSVDEQLARNSGFPSSFAPGMLAMGFMGELVVDWLRGARLRRFWSRFVKIVWPGDVITSRGRVTDRRFEGKGTYLVDIELWAENQKGELVVRGGVTAQLYYSAEDENRQRSGSGPLIVTPDDEQARLSKGGRGALVRKEAAGSSRALPSRQPTSAPAPSPVGPSARPHATARPSASPRTKKKAAKRPAPRPAARPQKRGKPVSRKKQKAPPRMSARRVPPKKAVKKR